MLTLTRSISVLLGKGRRLAREPASGTVRGRPRIIRRIGREAKEIRDIFKDYFREYSSAPFLVQ